MSDVLVLLGSKSDKEHGDKCLETLTMLGLTGELVISSAHRQPEQTAELARGAQAQGFKVIVCMAGMAAHLPGFVASQTALPVIGVPLSGAVLAGLDALLSIVQMPKGVPVAAVALDQAGAENAAVLAARIIALSRPDVYNRLEAYRKSLVAK